MNVGDKTAFYRTLEYILKDPIKIKYISDKAFEAVDIGNTGFLEKEEIEAIMQNVSTDLNLQSPNQDEINTFMNQIDYDNDRKVCKKDFTLLIKQVLLKMKEHEAYILHYKI